MVIGGKKVQIMAGPCSVESEKQLLTTAHAVKEAGAHVIRGGVWKPRTNPYSFQGDAKSLDILMEAHRRTGLPVDAEVMDERQLASALDAGVPMLQVGARNALNYSLLSAIGRAVANRPTVVLLKRSLHMGPLAEFISAAEYIASFGNPNVILCPRGTSPAPDGYRNHPDECITPLLKERTWAPVVVDPSHSVGKASYVPACALAAVASISASVCGTNTERGRSSSRMVIGMPLSQQQCADALRGLGLQVSEGEGTVTVTPPSSCRISVTLALYSISGPSSLPMAWPIIPMPPRGWKMPLCSS